MPPSRNLQRLGYRRIVQLLVYLIIIPTVLLLALGILLMFLGEARFNVLLGILTVSFVAVVATGVVLVIVFVRREANLSELQADFVSKVSHELRTPLTAIRLFAETLKREGNTDETTKKCIAMLNMETERLTRRIEQLLDWGRMAAGRKLYDLQEESIAGIVEEAVAAYSPLRVHETGSAHGADDDIGTAVDFAFEVAPGLPHVMADRHALVDAIVNLVSNAHKYGGTPPVVRLRAHAGAKGGVRIDVTDNGAGIPRVEQRRIFDKFYRIDDRLSRRRQGSGLGLAIVKHVVRAHQGHILVDSQSGRGSTFTIELPRAPASARVSSRPAPGARESARPPREIEVHRDPAE